MDEKLINFEGEEILYLFKRKFWIIIVVTALTTTLGFFKASQLQPSYSASAKVFMGNSSDMLTIYSESELSYYSQFLTIFSEIAKIDGFLEDTLNKHKIDKSALEVASALNFTSSANTPIVNIYYSSYTDYQMAETLDAVCEVLIEKVKEIMPNTNPMILSEASVATIYPDKKKLPTMAFGVGIIVSVGLILVLDYLDNKILTKRELEKALPVPVIGTIPAEEKEFKKEIRNVSSKENTKITVS